MEQHVPELIILKQSEHLGVSATFLIVTSGIVFKTLHYHLNLRLGSKS